MTVSSETYRVQYAGNDVTTAFTVPWRFLANSHIFVIHTDADDADTTWIEGTHYTLTGAGAASGTLTAKTTPTDYTPATDTRLTIIRDLPLTQTTDYVSNDDFPAQTHEDDHDRFVMLLQQVQEQLDRTIRLKVATTQAPLVIDDIETTTLLINLETGPHGAVTSRAALAASTVDSNVLSVLCLGYAVAGDCAPLQFERVTSSPRYLGVRSIDRYLPNGSIDNTNGGYWGYVPSAAGVDVCAAGYQADWNGTDGSATDNTAALQNAINFATLAFGTGFDTGGGGGNNVLLPGGTAKLNSTVTVHDGVQVVGKGTYGTVLKMADSFSTSTHFLRLGTVGDATAVCAAQSSGGGDLTINGTFAVGGVATFLQRRIVSVYSVGNDTGITFTIYGTSGTGASINEAVAGSNASSVDTIAYFATVTRVDPSGATAGNVTVGYKTVAAFGSRLEALQLWSGLVSGASGTAMVYTNNAQHTAGLKSVKIFGGNRHCAFFEAGIGASYFVFEDVETFNHGNSAGVASNNAQIKLNYAGLLTTIRNIVMSGPGAAGGTDAKGLEILGGNVLGDTIHVEGVAQGISIDIPNVDSGTVQLSNVNGGADVENLIHIKTATDNDTVHVSSIFNNGSDITIKDTPGAVDITGNVIPWTSYPSRFGTGNVVGPTSSTDNAAVRFDSTTGRLGQNSALIIADTTAALSRSGGGGIPLQGTNTNDAAASGDVGQQGSATGSPALTSGATAAVCNMSVPAGDFYISGTNRFSGAGATSSSDWNTNITTDSSPTLSATNSIGGVSIQERDAAAVDRGVVQTYPPMRVSNASATTYYMHAQATFTVSTFGCAGRMEYRRAR